MRMNIFNSIFGNKITIIKEMAEMAENLIENNWFCNCGEKSNANIQFRIAQENNIEEVEKKLSYKKDVRGFVTLDNLFIEGCRRGSLFLSLHHKKENEHTYNKLSETIHKEYISNYKFDFNAIEEKFNMKYDIEINLYLRDLFVSTLREVYYMNKLENYPAFFTDVIDVYLSGNVIIGWLGKFGSHNVQVKDIFPITPEDGVLNVW